MQKETIKGLLDVLKKTAVKAHIIKDMDNDQGLLDRPAINEDLNNMVESIYRELDVKLHKGIITQEEFDDLWQFTQDYCSYIQV